MNTSQGYLHSKYKKKVKNQPTLLHIHTTYSQSQSRQTVPLKNPVFRTACLSPAGSPPHGHQREGGPLPGPPARPQARVRQGWS
jgi:hypothetical protein